MSAADGEWLELQVPEGTRAERADKVLAGLLADMSRARLQKLLDDGCAWRDDAVLGRRERLAGGDVVHLRIPPSQPLALEPVAMDLEILYEDADILVLNKPSGLVVHPGAGTHAPTLVEGLLHHCAGKLSGIGGVERPGILHRLDKETSGVLVVAKTDRGHHGMARQFQERSLEKTYCAVLSAAPDWQARTVDAPIGRHPTQRTRMAIRTDGRSAVSHFRITGTHPFGARAEVRIETGRTHQIRVHAKSLGLPLVGDRLYGYRGTWNGRILLHAAQLRFTHPCDGRPLCIAAPCPF